MSLACSGSAWDTLQTWSDHAKARISRLTADLKLTVHKTAPTTWLFMRRVCFIPVCEREGAILPSASTLGAHVVIRPAMAGQGRERGVRDRAAYGLLDSLLPTAVRLGTCYPQASAK